MTQRKKHILLSGLVITVLSATAIWFFLFRGGENTLGVSFDPVRVARAETRMWQAYYKGDVAALSGEIMGVLEGEFQFAREDAAEIAKNLGRAALMFHVPVLNDEAAVLADLRRAYARFRQNTGGQWDVEEAARAELTWWQDRRAEGRSAPENVGRSISRLYTILSGKDNADIQKAGLLRARAADLRDSGGDWAEVERLLTE